MSPLLDSLTSSSAAVHTAQVTPASLGDSAHAALHNGPAARSAAHAGSSSSSNGRTGAGAAGAGAAAGADSNGSGVGREEDEEESFAFTKGCYFLGKAVWGKVRQCLTYTPCSLPLIAGASCKFWQSAGQQ